MKTTERVAELTEQLVSSMGFELCDVEYQKEYGNWVLTLFIDKPGGVTIDDCEAVSRAVEPVLDENDPIEAAYYLSVSSLGIDRPIKKDRDFERNIGAAVSVGLYAPLNGKKEYTGTLLSFDADSFTLDCADGSLTLKRKDAAIIRPVIEF